MLIYNSKFNNVDIKSSKNYYNFFDLFIIYHFYYNFV